MFEFEMKGDMEEMKIFEYELLDHLGFCKFYTNNQYPQGDYIDIANKYGVIELEHRHEELLKQDYGPIFFLKYFLNYSFPFWNMKQVENSNLHGSHA
jgi:hypothetical protein|tara:strand:+ start:400 stop:690 length:291 start_codon:yes stop_codon:yes gene_type:complete